ncbi:MAG: LPS assembly lipoprotein LptE [Methylobacillus sp.]|nr:LPS assembly lipoprotein LptE [Methylobacillus sp.]
MKRATLVRNFLLVFGLLTLAACGFQLRGMTDLGFKKIYIQQAQKYGSTLSKELRRSMRSSGVEIVQTPEEADMQVEIMDEKREKEILSLSGTGTVTEFEVYFRATWRWRESSDQPWSPPQSIEQRRDYAYSDAQALAKETEEQRLFDDMYRESAREIMRRLSALGSDKTSK